MSDMSMREIKLDARSWRDACDFYGALLAALGAPDWHGSGVAALIDSIIWGDDAVNKVKSPYKIVVAHAGKLSEDIRAQIAELSQALEESKAEFREKRGRNVDVSLRISGGS